MLGVLILAIANLSKAQVLVNVQKSFNNYAQHHLLEKLYVHTDKNLYITGEILWLKIYDVDGNTNKPLNLSKVAYAELLDNNNNAVYQTKIALNYSVGNGSIYLPSSINTGNYRLCVYTNWMKNFSADNYFQQTISIVNPLRSPETANNTHTENYDIQFFPEGGYLLNNISSRIGFRVVDEYGAGVNFTGAVIDEHNDTTAVIKPLKFGIGNFNLKPVIGHTYQAVLRIHGKIVKKDLPSAMVQGYNMAVTARTGSQIQITVHSVGHDAENIYLLAYTRQEVKQALSALLVNGVANFIVDENKLGEGISHLAIFDNTQRPVCERLVFKRPQALKINATAGNTSYQTRKKVSVEINATDKEDKPLIANLSMAIYHADDLQNNGAIGIQSYLWLNSELKGNIEQPDYYLNNNTAEANEAVDNLLLTQGWSAYKLTEILHPASSAFKFVPEYQGHIISAKLLNPQTGRPQKDVYVTLGVPGKRVQFYAASSDSTGHFVFNTQNFYGANELVVQPAFQSDSLLKIEVANPFTDRYPQGGFPALHLTKNYRNLLQNYSIGTQAQNIYQGDRIRPFYNPPIDSAAFYGPPKKVYMLDDYTRFTTMEEVLREYVHEVLVSRSQNKFHFKLTNGVDVQQQDPLVLLDGIPVHDMDKVIAIDPLKIKRLEVVPDRYYLRPLVNAGILSFTSYKNDLAGYEIDPHALVVDYEGMQLNRDFFSPLYDSPEQTANHLPDLRNVLYWQPNVVTDRNGKASVSFYTSDMTGSYKGVLQGITANGLAGGATFTIEVK